jgi:hypothetical protein
MPFFFSIGCTIGPAVGGFFAQPTETKFPLLRKSPLFEKFPYLLPNIICAGMVFLTMVFASVALKETHPKLRHRKARYVFWSRQHDKSSETPLLHSDMTRVENPSYGTRSDSEMNADPDLTGVNPFRGLSVNVWMLAIAISLLSAHTVTYIQLLPIFLRDPRDTSAPRHYIGGIGGLDMSLSEVGLVMGANGIIGLAVQLMFPLFTKRFGIRRTLLLVTTLHPISYFCVPYLAFLHRHLAQYRPVHMVDYTQRVFNFHLPDSFDLYQTVDARHSHAWLCQWTGCECRRSMSHGLPYCSRSAADNRWKLPFQRFGLVGIGCCSTGCCYSMLVH